QRFLAVPSKLAGQHSRLRTPQDVFAVATRLVHEALDLLAASSEAATGVPGIASSRGDGSERPGHRRQAESEEGVAGDLARGGAGGGGGGWSGAGGGGGGRRRGRGREHRPGSRISSQRRCSSTLSSCCARSRVMGRRPRKRSCSPRSSA